MKNKIIFFIIVLNIACIQAQTLDYHQYLSNALTALKNEKINEFKINMRYFSTAIEQKEITPENIPDKYLRQYTYCLAEGICKGVNITEPEYAYQFLLKNNDDPFSLFLLGYFYETNLIVTKDSKTSIEYYNEAAKLADANLLYEIGNRFYEGFAGFGKDEISRYTAAIWYTKSAEKGNPNAMNKLGELYTWGFYNISQNFPTARKWFLKAAELGNINSMRAIASYYYTGQGGTKNFKQSAYWYEEYYKHRKFEKVECNTMIHIYNKLKQTEKENQWKKFCSQ